MAKSLKKLRQSEHAAVKEYGAKAAESKRAGRPAESKGLRHIQREEKEHGRELGVMIRKRGQRSGTKPKLEDEDGG